ncbi:hypothetical protein ACQV2C_20300 [Pantoea allii]|uniref:hypothetical protein n=1 Tax=Pantoea allii TaxID=574096 RepID=UPI003D321C73
MIRVAVLAEPDSTGRPQAGAAKNGRGNRLTAVKTGRAAPLAPGDLQQATGNRQRADPGAGNPGLNAAYRQQPVIQHSQGPLG